MTAADRAELLSVFLRHEVRFLVIGGAAIQSHDRRYDTLDIDLMPIVTRPTSSASRLRSTSSSANW